MRLSKTVLSILPWFTLMTPPATASDEGWGISGAQAAIPATDLVRIGTTACGPHNYRVDDDGVVCRTCPDYTGNKGDAGDMTIKVRHIGHFSSARGPTEWLLDTAGCEAHFADFGGALLLADTKPASPAGGLDIRFYQPGYRVDDCLVWPVKDGPDLLVCNEVATAQGESVGFISMLDIERRGINRWRLLRWFDDSGSIQDQVVSIVPRSMQRISLKNGQPGLRITLDKLLSKRTDFEKEPGPSGQKITLEFQLRGRRLFATEATQGILEELSVLVRRMLD